MIKFKRIILNVFIILSFSVQNILWASPCQRGALRKVAFQETAGEDKKEEPVISKEAVEKEARALISLLEKARGAEGEAGVKPAEAMPLIRRLKELDAQMGYVFSLAPNAYASLRYMEDAFNSSAISAYTHQTASVAQMTESGLGKVFLAMLKGRSKDDVAHLPKWLRYVYPKVSGTILVLGRDYHKEAGITREQTLGRVVDFARAHLSAQGEETANIVVSDTLLLSPKDPLLEEAIKADPALEAYVIRNGEGAIIGFTLDSEMGRFVCALLTRFLKDEEPIVKGSTPRFLNLGNIVNCNPVSPLGKNLRGERRIDRFSFRVPDAALADEESFCVGTGGGDCAGLNNCIAIMSDQLSEAEYPVSAFKHPASLYGVLYAFEGMSSPDFEKLRVHISAAKANEIYYTASTDLRSSRKNVFAMDEDGRLKNPEAVIQLILNLTGYKVRYTGNPADGYMGIVLDKEEWQKRAYSRFRGVVITGGNDHMAEAEKLFQLVEALGIRNKYGYLFQVIVVPKSIDNDASTKMLGFRSAAEFFSCTFDAFARAPVNKDKIKLVECMGRAAGWLTLMGAEHTKSIVVIPEKDTSIKTIYTAINRYIKEHGAMPAIMLSEGWQLNEDDLDLPELMKNPLVAAKLSKKPIRDPHGNIKLTGTRDYVAAIIKTFCVDASGKPITNEGISMMDATFIGRGLPASDREEVLASRYAEAVREAVDQGLSGVAVAFPDLANTFINSTSIVEISRVLPQKTVTSVNRYGQPLYPPELLAKMGVVCDDYIYQVSDRAYHGPVDVCVEVSADNMHARPATDKGLLFGNWEPVETPGNPGNTPAQVIDSIVKCAGYIVETYGPEQVLCVNLAVPGLFDSEMKLIYSSNIPCLPEGFDYKTALENALNAKYPRAEGLGPIRVNVIHNMSAAALTEIGEYGTYTGSSSLLFVNAGQGIGLQYIKEGKMLSGDERVSHAMDEMAHCLVFNGDVDNPDYRWVGLTTKGMRPDFTSKQTVEGEENPFYKKQSAEDRCGASGIVRYALKLVASGQYDKKVLDEMSRYAPSEQIKSITAAGVGKAAMDGNKLAGKAVTDRARELGCALAVGLASAVKSGEYDSWPEHIVVGSDMAQVGHVFLSAVREGFSGRLQRYATQAQSAGQETEFTDDRIDSLISRIVLSRIPDDSARELLWNLPTREKLDEHAALAAKCQEAEAAIIPISALDKMVDESNTPEGHSI